jgi:hypothetical protein
VSDYIKGLEEQLEQMRQKLAALEVERDDLIRLKPFWKKEPYWQTVADADGLEFTRWRCDYGTDQYCIGYVFSDAETLELASAWRLHFFHIKISFRGIGSFSNIGDARACMTGLFKEAVDKNLYEL